jgi:hypothetical protein
MDDEVGLLRARQQAKDAGATSEAIAAYEGRQQQQQELSRRQQIAGDLRASKLSGDTYGVESARQGH